MGSRLAEAQQRLAAFARSPLRAIQIEDVALFAWFALGEPFLGDLLGGLLPQDLPARLATDRSPLLGALLLGAAAAAVLCLATRDKSETAMVGDEGWLSPGTYARLPMLVVLALLVDEGFSQLGSRVGERLFPWIVVFVGGTLLAQPWLPVLAAWLRRLLMLPVVAVGAVMFPAAIEDLVGDMRLDILVRGGEAVEVAAAQLAAVIVAVGSLLYYVLFVFAPRQVAAGRGSWLYWLWRVGLFIAGLLSGLIWGGDEVWAMTR